MTVPQQPTERIRCQACDRVFTVPAGSRELPPHQVSPDRQTGIMCSMVYGEPA
jgi:hypothetical protein